MKTWEIWWVESDDYSSSVDHLAGKEHLERVFNSRGLVSVRRWKVAASAVEPRGVVAVYFWGRRPQPPRPLPPAPRRLTSLHLTNSTLSRWWGQFFQAVGKKSPCCCYHLLLLHRLLLRLHRLLPILFFHCCTPTPTIRIWISSPLLLLLHFSVTKNHRHFVNCKIFFSRLLFKNSVHKNWPLKNVFLLKKNSLKKCFLNIHKNCFLNDWETFFKCG